MLEKIVYDQLKSRGLRVTRARRAIAQLLATQTESYTIDQLDQRLPNLGRATVYRGVKLLTEMGVLCRVTHPNRETTYTVARDSRQHHHYICVICGDITDVASSELDSAVDRLNDQRYGSVVEYELRLYGRCNRCLKNKTDRKVNKIDNGSSIRV